MKISEFFEVCWVKLKLLKKAIKVGYSFKIPFVSISLWSKNIIIFVQTCWVTLRGVAGPHPFFEKRVKLLKKVTCIFGKNSIWVFFQNSVCTE